MGECDGFMKLMSIPKSRNRSALVVSLHVAATAVGEKGVNSRGVGEVGVDG